MPTWLAIVLLALLALVVLATVGGAIVMNRRRHETEASFRASLAEVDQALAAAHAEDKGWDPAVLDTAAREAFARAHPDVAIETVTLIQVVDRPGTDEDRAVFRVATPGGETEIALGRTGGAWHAEPVA